MAAKTMVGARAKIYVNNVLVGLFDSCSYAVNVGAEPIHTLGRFSPNEIVPTSYEAVTINCSGFRIIGNGGHILPAFPRLQDLLNLESVTLSVTDRQSGDTILNVAGCVPVNYSTGYNAKATSRIQVTYLGIKAEEEIGDNGAGGAEDEGSATSL